MEQLHGLVKDRPLLQSLMADTKRRQVEGRYLDRHPTVYVGTTYCAFNQVWQKSQATSPQGMPLFDGASECELKTSNLANHLSQMHVEFHTLENWTLPSEPVSELGDDFYLGQ